MDHVWFEVLKAARELSPDGATFTAAGLASMAHIQETSKSTPEKIAAGWISKFLKWGYVKRTSKAEQDHRLVQWYVVTPYGHACAPREASASQLDRLCQAVRAYEEVKVVGPKERQAWKNLIHLCGEFETKDGS